MGSMQRQNGRARLQSCRKSRDTTQRDTTQRDTTHSVIPNEVWDLLFPCLDCGSMQPPANAAVGARHAVPLFHFRLSTVDCRPLHRADRRPRYFAAGFSGLNTPCGLSFQIQA